MHNERSESNRERISGMNESTAFTNEQIDRAALPDYRRVDLEPVASAYVPYAMLSAGLFWLFVLGAAAVVNWQPFINLDVGWWPMLVMGASILAAVWFVLIAWLDARRRGWAVREHDLIYRYGVIWRKTVILPFARIQHVETANGPLERWFGLMRVKCFTAGGMSSDLSVEGLDIADARRVRQHLLEQIREDAETGGRETDREESPEEEEADRHDHERD